MPEALAIAKIQHRIDTLRKVLNQSLDEIQAQLDGLGGAEEQRDAGAWEKDLRELMGTKK